MTTHIMTTRCHQHLLAFRLIRVTAMFLAFAAISCAPSLSMGQTYSDYSWKVKRNGVEVTVNPSLFENGDRIRQDLTIRVFNDQAKPMWVHMRLTVSSSPHGNLGHTSNTEKLWPSQSDTRVGVIQYDIPADSEELAYNLSFIVFLSPHEDPNQSPMEHIMVEAKTFVFQRFGGGGGGGD